MCPRAGAGLVSEGDTACPGSSRAGANREQGPSPEASGLPALSRGLRSTECSEDWAQGSGSPALLAAWGRGWKTGWVGRPEVVGYVGWVGGGARKTPASWPPESRVLCL